MTIEANTPKDWGMRGATNTTLPQFKGKPRQLIVNVDDGYRPIIMDGSTTGGKFKCISVDEVSSKYLPLTGGTITKDLTVSGTTATKDLTVSGTTATKDLTVSGTVRVKSNYRTSNLITVVPGDTNGAGDACYFHGTGGLTVVGSGDSVSSVQNNLSDLNVTPASEVLTLSSDTYINFITNANTWSNRQESALAGNTFMVKHPTAIKGELPSKNGYAEMYINSNEGYTVANRLAGVSAGALTNGSTQAKLCVYDNKANSTDYSYLSLNKTKDGIFTATLSESPQASSNNNSIATTKWVNDAIAPLATSSEVTTELNKKANTVDVNTKLAEYLPLAGGNMIGNIFFNPSVPGAILETEVDNHNGLVLRTDGSLFTIRSLSSKIDPGSFAIRARDSESNDGFWLEGKQDGSLSWGGANIVRTVNGASADTNGNVLLSMGEENIKELGNTYILFKNNVLIQWKHYEYVTCAKYLTRYTYNFAKPFASIPAFFATPNSVEWPTMLGNGSGSSILKTSDDNTTYYIFYPTTTGISYQATTSGAKIWLSFIAIGFAA